MTSNSEATAQERCGLYHFPSAMGGVYRKGAVSIMKQHTIAVVGLGLIGGSLAAGLMDFEESHIIGVVRRQETADYALAHGYVHEATLDAAAALKRADLTILSATPEGILSFLRQYHDQFQPGSLVTDVCGIKTVIMEAAEQLPPGVDYIGSHPMAGTEFAGIEHAIPNMFRGSNWIMVPRETSTQEHKDLICRVARHVGCQDVREITPERHDAIIAYTSQLMHIVALSVCDDAELFQCKGYEGSSFRDVTRVAALDPDMWTDLMGLNAPALSQVIRRMEENLHAYRIALDNQDRERLHAKLSYSSNRKRRINLPGSGQIPLH